MLGAVWLTLPSSSGVNMQNDRAIIILVGNTDQRLGVEHLHAKLFIELAGEGRERRFARLDFATRKLPTTTLVTVRVAPGDQHLIGAVMQNPNRDLQRRFSAHD
jgi:hypothetical protein